MSHDLRNPLNVAQGRLELGREGGPEAAEHLDAVRRALDRMDTLIDDLLALARGEADPDTDDYGPVDLASVLEDSWAHVRTDGATLDVALDRVVRADRSRLQQLLENLIRNSVEHGSTGSRTESGDSVEHGSTGNRPAADDSVEHGGREVTITAGELASGDGFYFEDDGPGIPADQHETVFDLGYSSEADGTGLGLNIVKQVADAHGWHVRVTDSDSGGARFEVTDVAFVE